MTKARPQVLSLNRGELDSEAISRSDMDSYASSAAVFENAVPAVKGGLFRAPGSRFIGRTLALNPAEDSPAWLCTWRYSRRQAITVEFGHEHLRMVYDTGYIQAGGGDLTFGAWADDSSGGGSTSTTEPDWPSLPPPAPPSGGSGHNPGPVDPEYCVAVTSYLPTVGMALNVRAGIEIEALGEDLSELTLRLVEVERVEFADEPCVRIRSQTGGELVVSKATRITQPDGSGRVAEKALGAQIAVRRGSMPAPIWEAITAVDDVGVQRVARIVAHQCTYAAGAKPGVYLYTHNFKVWDWGS